MAQIPEIKGVRQIAAGKYLTLKEIHFTDEQGRSRIWESTGRVGGTGAVMIVPRLVPGGDLVLVRQFRPPAGCYMIEFPAGLIEQGESPELTAVRELYEETGYEGTVDEVIPASCNSPGMSGETMILVKMSIDRSRYPEQPCNHQEDSENIEVFTVPVSGMKAFVDAAVKRGDGIDSKVAVFTALLA